MTNNQTAPAARKPISPMFWSVLAFVAAVALLIWSAVHLILSWNEYSHTGVINSAPFSLWVYTTLIVYVVPAVVLVILGFWYRNKARQQS